MSQSNNEDQLPERNAPTSPDNNAEKDNKCKKLKEENVKKENDVRKRLSEISAPKKRKILDKMMKKYHRDPFYQPIDIAKKILKKLRVNNTQYFITRIRQDMKKWKEENDDSDENNTTGSKKKVLREAQKKENTLAATNDETAKEKANPEAVAGQAGPAEAKKKVQHSKTKPTHPAPVIEKEVPVIDLTIDLKKEIKKEVITIEEDSISASNAKEVNSTTTNTLGALPVMQYPMIGYNPNVFYHPERFWPYYPNPYHDQMYNPYMYQYEYPYNPYFYNSPCNSDYLPNYPVDHSSTQDPMLINTTVDTSLPKNADQCSNHV